jgi:hypothetical protein
MILLILHHTRTENYWPNSPWIFNPFEFLLSPRHTTEILYNHEGTFIRRFQ